LLKWRRESGTDASGNSAYTGPEERNGSEELNRRKQVQFGRLIAFSARHRIRGGVRARKLLRGPYPISLIRARTLHGLALDPESHLDSIVLRDGYYEKPILDAIMAHLPTDGVLWDVGANVGIHSVTAKHLCPTATVVAFEPVPFTAARLTLNAEFCERSEEIVLKVLHIPFTFAPDPVGGTEIYVEALVQSLRKHNIECVVAAPSSKGTNEAYEYNGVGVRRYRSAPESRQMLQELYGEGDPEARIGFSQILDEERPDVVHIHALTRAVSILLVRTARERGLPVVFTYHTPTVSCQRGTMMLRGKQMCDGVLIAQRCASCVLEARGLPHWATVLLRFVPAAVVQSLEKRGLNGGVWTAFRMTNLMRLRHDTFRAFMREVDSIVVPREWVRTVLLKNGVPAAKITLSHHGLPDVSERQEPLIDVAKVPLRVAFLGRADKVKGVDTLIRAVRAAPELRVELHLYGVAQSDSDRKYWHTLVSLAGQDPRISFLQSVPHDGIVSLLRGYHVLAVPSRTAETGPLVVLESFLAGTPVIGANLGGISERVRHEHNGLLVHHEDVLAWVEALRRCAEDRRLLARLRAGVERPRSMEQVAQEMAQIYYRHVPSPECSHSNSTACAAMR
jgi:glycosyltransferase involved in cell wall biosynthesis